MRPRTSSRDTACHPPPHRRRWAGTLEIETVLSPKLRRDILDVLAQTAGFTLIGVLVIETTLRLF